MSKERELLKKLVHWCWQTGTVPTVLQGEIEELLAQPELILDMLAMVEPVAWVSPLVIPFESYRVSHPCVLTSTETTLNKTPLYTSPPTREPLSEKEIQDALIKHRRPTLWYCGFKAGVKYAEKAHGIGVDDE